MNEGIKKLIEDLESYDAAKRDELACADDLIHYNGGFYFKGQPIDVTEAALRQLCSFSGIPADFFRDSLTASEQAILFNRLYHENNASAARLYRLSNDTLYGVVSHRYHKIDNAAFIPVLKKIDNFDLDLKPVKLILNPDHTKIRLVPTDYADGEMAPMIEFTNSENGLGSMKVWAGVYRQVCTNGLMVEIKNLGRSRWSHIGSAGIDMPDLHSVMNVSLDYLKRLDSARTVYLNSDAKEYYIMHIAEELGHDAADKVVEAAQNEYHNGRTLFDLVNSITRAAQSFNSRRQTEIENCAARLLAA
jgi:hypothetical protein